MRLPRCGTLALVLLLLAVPVFAQSTPADIIRTLLAAGRLPTVVDTPLYFRLLRLRLTPSDQVTYAGPNAMVFALSGAATLLTREGSAKTMPEGGGIFIPTDQPSVLRAAGSEPVQILIFVLTPAAELQKAMLIGSVPADELLRSALPLPSLRPGPYEFSLTRVTFPPRMPPNPPHHRSGAALYYVLAGTGSLVADGAAKSMPTGTPIVEPYGWVHQWGNPGDVPLVMIQANIAQEGIPVVIPGGPQGAK